MIFVLPVSYSKRWNAGQVAANHVLLFPELGSVTCKRLELPASTGKAFAIVGTALVKGTASQAT